MARDHRYDLIRSMLEKDNIKSFNDIFKYIPKSVVAADIGKKNDRFSELMNKVEDFTLAELYLIAKLCNLSDTEILKIANTEHQIQKGHKRNIGKHNNVEK